MNKNELKELVKKYFSLTEMTEENNTTVNNQAKKFDSATLVDGTKITNMKDSTFAVGDELHVITESGEHVIAPSGEHTTESGITITVSEDGKITGIARPDAGDEGSLAEHDDINIEMANEDSSDAKTKFDEKDIEIEMKEHYEEIIEVIMAEVGPAIAELKEKMDKHAMKLAEHEEKMTQYMSAPSSKPTKESLFKKSTKDIDTPAAVFNVKRYEAALSRLTKK
tara:strand:+ start:4465 stop:5136 length:672 start_codon:yes stop_codon:yes gene_type:complete